MECKACRLELNKLLCAIPSEWREQIVNVICTYIADQKLDCAKIAECLSDEMTTLDFKCLATTQAEWDALTFNGKIQRIIDKVCAFISTLDIHTQDSPTIDFSGQGTLIDPLTAVVIKSPDAGNILDLRLNGIYVPPAITTITNQDTFSINLSGDGSVATPLTADVIINPDPNNLTTITSTGLLTLLNKPNLKQHIIFERPPITTLASNNSRFYISSGSYATDYTAANPDVDLNWGEGPIEHSLDNEAGAGNSLSHDYLILDPEAQEIELKTYNTTYLTNLVASKAVSGFKFLKGGSLINTISYGIVEGTSSVLDFKGMYNVTNLELSAGSLQNYGGKGPRITLANTQDLHSLTRMDLLYSYFQGDRDIELLGPTTTVQLATAHGLKSITAHNQTYINFIMDASGLDHVDLKTGSLTRSTLTNNQQGFGGYLNNLSLKLKPYSTAITNGQFDLSTLIQFYWSNNHGITVDDNNFSSQIIGVKPTKILMYDVADQQPKFFDINQDWIKDEFFISINNNGLNNGSGLIINDLGVSPFGLNSRNIYYNPTYAPLNGMIASLVVTLTGGVVSAASLDSRHGFGYSSVPTVVTSGPGAGAVINPIMEIDLDPQNISSGGTGHTVGESITLSGGTFIVPAIIQVTSVTSGVIDAYTVTNRGEYTSIPSLLTGSGGLQISTTNKFSVKRYDIPVGGSGYDATSIFKLEVSTLNGTGSGTASATAKAAIDALHNKGWDLAW